LAVTTITAVFLARHHSGNAARRLARQADERGRRSGREAAGSGLVLRALVRLDAVLTLLYSQSGCWYDTNCDVGGLEGWATTERQLRLLALFSLLYRKAPSAMLYAGRAIKWATFLRHAATTTLRRAVL